MEFTTTVSVTTDTYAETAYETYVNFMELREVARYILLQRCTTGRRSSPEWLNYWITAREPTPNMPPAKPRSKHQKWFDELPLQQACP